MCVGGGGGGITSRMVGLCTQYQTKNPTPAPQSDLPLPEYSVDIECPEVKSIQL